LRAAAEAVPGGVVDLSIGTPCDPPPDEAMAAMADAALARSYPPSVGTAAYLDAARGWLSRRFGLDLPVEQVAACVGTKELVASVPQFLRLRTPQRDTVLYPAVSYPTYEMGATLGGCRAVPVPVDEHWRIRLDAISDDDAARALCLWVNTPGNPAGGLDDLDAAARWGRAHGVPVFSDECYVEFTWHGGPRTILEHGVEGVVAVHSLSKRSNLAGARIGFYAGDPELVGYLSEVRKHAGLMPPGPVQAAGAWAWSDDAHVSAQRTRYRERIDLVRDGLEASGLIVPEPAGAFYLWVPAPDGDAWALAHHLASVGGALVSPGDLYGEAGRGHVRVAVVQPLDRIRSVVHRLVERSRSHASS
jgi:aspartate/methionine/tyrosine aminotransferase